MWDVKPGDKVTPIMVLNAKGNTDVILPKMGVVYTVRDVCEGYTTDAGFLPAIRLVEITNPVQHLIVGPGSSARDELKFALRCFRPVISNKGMETLRAILKDPTKPIHDFEQAKVRKRERA